MKTCLFNKNLQGVKIKMDDAGNILVRRYAKSNVYIKSASLTSSDETAIGADVIKQPNQSLEIEKVYKVSYSYQRCKNNLTNTFYRLDFRHEKIPVKRKPRVESSISRPSPA